MVMILFEKIDQEMEVVFVCICIALLNINYWIRHDLVPKNFEALCIEIIKPQSQPVVIVTAYRPPNSSSDFFFI
jgi:hypothetical protein